MSDNIHLAPFVGKMTTGEQLRLAADLMECGTHQRVGRAIVRRLVAQWDYDAVLDDEAAKREAAARKGGGR